MPPLTRDPMTTRSGKMQGINSSQQDEFSITVLAEFFKFTKIEGKTNWEDDSGTQSLDRQAPGVEFGSPKPC